MEVLVTGGAGFLGRRICEMLKENGHRYHCLALEDEDASGMENVTRGDITKIDTLKFPPIDTVIHCAGILESSHPTDAMMFKVNFEGTKNVFKAGQRSGMNRFIFISTISAIGPLGSMDRPIREYTKPSPDDVYGSSKLKAEHYLKSAYDRDGPDIIILRPTVLYGPGMNLDSSGMKTFTALKKGIMPMVGNGSTIYNMLFVDNLVEAVRLVMVSGKGFSTYNVSEGPYLQKDVIGAIEKKIGRKGHKRYPKPVLWTMTLLSEVLSPFFKGPPPLSWTKFKGLTTNAWNTSSDLIREELGYREVHTLEEGVSITCNHYGW